MGCVVSGVGRERVVCGGRAAPGRRGQSDSDGVRPSWRFDSRCQTMPRATW